MERHVLKSPPVEGALWKIRGTPGGPGGVAGRARSERRAGQEGSKRSTSGDWKRQLAAVMVSAAQLLNISFLSPSRTHKNAAFPKAKLCFYKQAWVCETREPSFF